MNSVDQSGNAHRTATPQPSARPFRLALYETSVEGHRGAYLTAITSEAIRRGWSVTLVTPAKDRIHPYYSHLRELLGPSNLLFTPCWIEFPRRVSAWSMLRYHFDQWQATRQSLSYSDRTWDYVYAPNIDYMDKAIQIRGVPSFPTPMGGMTMRVRFHLKQLGVQTHRALLPSLGSLAFSRLLQARGLASITTADPSLFEYCQNQRASRYRRVAYVPEIGMVAPTIDCAAARQGFGFGPEDQVILVFGFIDERKAIKELVAALECVNSTAKTRILVVGRPDQATGDLLSSPKFTALQREGTLVTRLGFADDRTQEMAFAAADVVWVAYRNHSTMSGVLSQAISCSLPVIGPNYGLLSWLVSQYNVGITVDVDNPSETGRRIVAMLQDTTGMQALRSNSGRISNNHRPQDFGAAVCDAIAASRAARTIVHSPTGQAPAA
jgi:glycosyltransferase involved in cell wall biosynthesis